MIVKHRMAGILLACLFVLSARGVWAQTTPQTKERPIRTDRYGDPLPEGALRRLGTMRFRHGNGANVAFSADGKNLLTCGGDRTIRTWDAVSGKLLRTMKVPLPPFTSIFVFSPDGRYLAFPDHDATKGFLSLWDVGQGRLHRKFPLEVPLKEAVFSTDGKTLVTAQCRQSPQAIPGGMMMRLEEALLQVWDVPTGQSRLLGKQPVRALSFAADGTLITVSRDRTISSWDLAKGREQNQWSYPENVAGTAFSPDGQTVATWSWHNEDKDKGVEFWEATTGKPKKGWIAPNLKQILGVRFTPDGKEVLIGAQHGAMIWDPATGKSRYKIAGPKAQEIAFSPDGRTVAALGGGDANFPHGSVLFVWDLASGKSRAPNDPDLGHFGQVDSVVYSPDGKTIASSSQTDRTLRLWETATGRLLRTLPMKEDINFHSLMFTPDGKYVLQGTTAAIIRYDAATGREASRIPLYQAGKEDRQHLIQMHLSDNGRTLLASSQNLDAQDPQPVAYGSSGIQAFQAWNLSTGKRLHSTRVEIGDLWLGYSCCSPDGRLFIVPGGKVLDTTTGKEVLSLSVGGMSLGMPVAISRDGAYVAQSAFKVVKGPNFQRTDGIGVQIWEMATLLPVARLETGPLAHLAFTPDNRRLITAGLEAIKLWDIGSAKVLTERQAPARFRGSYGDSFVSSMALAPDGRTVATGLVDSTILLWDLATPAMDRPIVPLKDDQLKAYWADLAGTDGGRAFAAITHLIDMPEQSVTLMRDRLQPAKAPSSEELGRLVADLNSAEFARREAATKQLTELGELAEAALRKALSKTPPLEVQRRIETLLALPPLARTPEARRNLRAVRVLEGIGTQNAQDLLQRLAGGAAEARLTQEAKAALARLQTKAAQLIQKK
jgi:WD40 repeat protein